jgi:Protein of unknown function (DUF4239)
MNPLAISLLVFACVFGGAVAGILLRRALPEDHLNADSRNTVNRGIGLVGTMAALVLGLVVSSAASSYFGQRDELNQISAKLVFLDRILAQYGPAAEQARHTIQELVDGILDRFWPQEHAGGPSTSPVGGPDALYDAIQRLSPQDEEHRVLKSDALGVARDIGRTRWLMFAKQSSQIPTAFLAVVAVWLSIVFASFGLYAPRNATVIVALLLGALSVGGAILLIMELYAPFEGWIQIPSAPLRAAFAQLGK